LVFWDRPQMWRARRVIAVALAMTALLLLTVFGLRHSGTSNPLCTSGGSRAVLVGQALGCPPKASTRGASRSA
jgi:hypothetical protein